MQKNREDAAVGRTFIALGIAASLLAWVSYTYFNVASEAGPIWVILPLLALLAEMIPVELSRRGVRMAFSLPFVAGVAFAKGPLFAIATDVLVTLVAGYTLVRRRRSKTASLWLGINVFVGTIGTAIASITLFSLDLWVGAKENPAIASLVFMLAYGLTNFTIVTYLDAKTSDRAWSENLASTFKLAARSFALYSVVGMSVAVLVVSNLVHFVPITLVPVFALRTALQYQARMYEHYYETITALTLMLQRAHPYTHGHLERVAKAAEEVARRLGLSGARARMVREAAVLHDIGKIAVDESILDKPAKLTEEEMSHVRMHSTWGAEILQPVRGFREIRPWILFHHERPDGQGYPHGLKDVDIPIESKIIAVVDAYDAMTGSEIPGAKRSYRDSMSVEEALAELGKCSGTQFDGRVVQAFRSVVMEGRF